MLECSREYAYYYLKLHINSINKIMTHASEINISWRSNQHTAKVLRGFSFILSIRRKATKAGSQR